MSRTRPFSIFSVLKCFKLLLFLRSSPLSLSPVLDLRLLVQQCPLSPTSCLFFPHISPNSHGLKSHISPFCFLPSRPYFAGFPISLLVYLPALPLTAPLPAISVPLHSFPPSLCSSLCALPFSVVPRAQTYGTLLSAIVIH